MTGGPPGGPGGQGEVVVEEGEERSGGPTWPPIWREANKNKLVVDHIPLTMARVKGQSLKHANNKV